MFSTMSASYYVVHCEEFVDYNYHIYRKKATLLQDVHTTLKEEKKHSSGFKMLLNWILTKRTSNMVLIFYASLSFLLMLDNKDSFVDFIFGLITLTFPIHMNLLARATPADPKLNAIYMWYLPLFISCISLVLFRYLLFFQK
jgi:hypothetical protein